MLGFVTDIAILGTHITTEDVMHTVFAVGIMVSSNCMMTHTCYDRGRGACCATWGDIYQ